MHSEGVIVVTQLLARAIPAHVLVAAEQGMKAGFRQFASASQKSGLPTVKKSWKDFAPLNQKGRFNLYCSTFGPIVESLGTPKAAASNASVVEDRTDAKLQELIEQAAALQLLIDAYSAPQSVKVADKPKAKRTRSTPKAEVVESAGIERKFTAGAVEMFDIPTTKGATFEYEGKAGTFTWKVKSVKRDGSIIAVR